RVGGHFPLLFRSNGLLLEKRSKEFVRVLNRAERQDVGRIDLVEDTDLAVETGIVRERILFEVVHAGFKRRSIASDRSDSGEGVHVGTVRKLDGGILRLHAGLLKGG